MEYKGVLVFATYLCLSFSAVALCEDVGYDTYLMNTVQRFLNARRLQKRNALKYVDEDGLNIKDLLDRLKRVKRHSFIDTGARASSTTSTTTTTGPPPPPTNPPSTTQSTQAPTTTPTTNAPFKFPDFKFPDFKFPVFKLPDFPKGFYWGRISRPKTGIFGNKVPGSTGW